MTRYIQRSWELSRSLSVNHTAYWVRLRGIRWHLVMTKRVLSCHLQLSPLSLWAVFPFCHHLSAPCYRIQVPSKVSFSTPTDQTYFVSPSSLRGPLFLHPSLSAPSFRPLCYSPVFFVITFHLEVGSGGVRQHGAKHSWGFILWKTSHLNADGNIFRWFNSTPCNIPNQGFVFFALVPLLCLLSLLQTAVFD